MGMLQWGHGDSAIGMVQWGHRGAMGMAQWGYRDGTTGTTLAPAQLGLGWSSWGTLQHHARGTPSTHRGFVLASRGVKALGDAVALSEMCWGGEGSCFLYISRFTEVQEERERKEKGRRKGRD